MTEYESLKKALDIARKRHTGQKDKGGDEYIFHPVIVAMQGTTLNEKIVGLLHDVMEDNTIGITFDTIKECGFSDDVISALKLLTHDKSVSYKDYIMAIGESRNPTAMSVKLYDLTMNMDISRNNGNRPPKYDLYRWAHKYLSDMKETLYGMVN